MVALRRDLHQQPEIAHQEFRTAELIADRLRACGLDEVRTGVGQTGVVGRLRGRLPGLTVLLRADMDALPLVEADRGQPYRSQREGMHHACGHDGHVAILLTVADLLSERRSDLPGSVSFVFQPAEERVGGAAGMIADAALEPRPDACFGLHLWNEVPVGTVDIRSGPIFANADSFTIELRAPGGHGAMPQQTPDPIVGAASIVTALQTLIAREVSPLEPATLTIGSIHGGTVANVIPSRVALEGTLRTFDAELRDRLLRRLREIVGGIAQTLRLEVEVTATDGCPACVNDARMAAHMTGTARRLLGESGVTSGMRTGAADDMSLFLDAVPGCYVFVGSANPARGLSSPHHSPEFDFDEAALEIGAELLAQSTLDYLLGAPREG
jgi:amidohydrolase